MTECRYPLKEKEKELGTWTTNIIISDAGCYPVTLTITNINLILHGEFEISLSSIIDIAIFDSHYLDQFMIIPRKNIIKITPRKSVLNKRITIMTCDNNEFIIDCCMHSIDSILEALK